MIYFRSPAARKQSAGLYGDRSRPCTLRFRAARPQGRGRARATGAERRLCRGAGRLSVPGVGGGASRFRGLPRHRPLRPAEQIVPQTDCAVLRRRAKAKPEDRHAAISRLCEQAGGKLVSLYFTLGQYDFMVVSEMPDAKAASVLAFVATGGGGIEGSVTTQAFTTAEAREMLAAAGRITDYKPMGAS